MNDNDLLFSRILRQERCCKNNFPHLITSVKWPTYSLDLNPFDFSVLSVLEKKACATPQKIWRAWRAHFWRSRTTSTATTFILRWMFEDSCVGKGWVDILSFDRSVVFKDFKYVHEIVGLILPLFVVTVKYTKVKNFSRPVISYFSDYKTHFRLEKRFLEKNIISNSFYMV